MRSTSRVGRVAALAAVIAAVVLVAIVLFGSGSEDYTVTAKFQNAGQVVRGNQVQIGGTPAGSVKSIDVTPDGQAEIEFSVDEKYAPLKRGSKVLIRQASQSGIANRYIDIQIPSGGRGEEIPDGGEVGIDATTTAVDLDQLFNTLDPPTRKNVQRFFKGNARLYAGRGRQANKGWRYLSASLSTSSKLFNELNEDSPRLERFLVDSAKLVTALAERRDDLTNLVTNLNDTTRALGSEKQALASAIGRLPDFMRRGNTTFVNLRSALDEVDPLVEASKPVAKKLRPFFAQLRPLTRDARPTLRDLSAIVQRRGRSNDLIELVKSSTPLADITVDSARRNGAERRGAFPETAEATKKTVPIIAQGRPYTPDLFGWFDDFSTSGNIDALGGFLRFQVYFNALSVTPGGVLSPLGVSQQEQAFRSNVNLNQYARCPGAADPPAPDGSNVFSEAEQKELDCSEANRATKAR